MEDNRFIDRYFESEAILLKIENTEKRSMTTFMNYLENLHSVGDKLRDKFNCNIKNIPEFVILRIIRNYFHHVEDIEEYSIFVELEEWAVYHNNRHLIISIQDFAKAIKSFINNNKNKKYVEKQIELACEYIEYEIINNVDIFSNSAELLIDNKIYELGIDIFKYVYNISNIIADECREIELLKDKEVIKNLEETYTKDFNIPKQDLLCMPGNIPIMTTEGLIFPKNSIQKVK
ncbi:hypothetical protein [Sulfurimonas microaerophilic]|uniref:hypothetical protein n=1 Tax=Sulfurimonas microaerophilic TaxID=3058392 RepID=UPI00271465A4|nr:hypothetical protein [Sulfurimonas sp. hsl 1-7]